MTLMVRSMMVVIVVVASISTISASASGEAKDHNSYKCKCHAVFRNGSKIMKNLQKLVRSEGKTCPKRMARFCKRESHFTDVLRDAVKIAVQHCHEQFKYTRWNCTIEKRLFDDVSRETSVVTAIFAASLTHAFAKSCVTTKLKRCDKLEQHDVSWTDKHWELRAPSDDLKFGRRMARRILAGPRTRALLKTGSFEDVVSLHNLEVGLKAADIMEESCECYGYSSSCTVKRCRKSLKAFNHPAKLLRSRYTEARMVHEAESPDRRRLLRAEKNRFYYSKPSPNFCSETHGRECRDEMNCSVLCCARGFRAPETKRKRRPRKCKNCEIAERKLYCK